MPAYSYRPIYAGATEQLSGHVMYSSDTEQLRRHAMYSDTETLRACHGTCIFGWAFI